MKTFDYTFEEFANHLRAWSVVRHYDTVQLDYSKPTAPGFVGTSRTLDVDLLRLGDYFAQIIADPEQRTFKSARFVLALTFLSQHLHEFAAEGLVQEDPRGATAAIAPRLVRALHELFAAPRLPSGISVAEAVARARRYAAPDPI